MVHTHNTSTWDVEVGGSKVQGPLLPTGSYTSLSYTILKYNKVPEDPKVLFDLTDSLHQVSVSLYVKQDNRTLKSCGKVNWYASWTTSCTKARCFRVLFCCCFVFDV